MRDVGVIFDGVIPTGIHRGYEIHPLCETNDVYRDSSNACIDKCKAVAQQYLPILHQRLTLWLYPALLTPIEF